VHDCEVFEWLREKIVQGRQVRPEVVQLDSSLSGDLMPDSFELIELVSAIEKEFQLRIDYEDFVEMDTIGDVVHFIQERANKR